MLNNYLKMILRNIIKKKTASIIIVISFAIGLSCINIIASFVIYEYSTDSFNINKDHIYRLLIDDPFSKGELKTAIPTDVPQIMSDRLPGIKDYCQTSFYSTPYVKTDNKEFRSETNILQVSPSFFNIFSFELLLGSYPKHPEEILLNENKAEKFYGKVNPVGKSLQIKKGNEELSLTVAGILKDIPYNSHFKYDFISYLDKNNFQSGSAYVLLDDSTDPDVLEDKLSNLQESLLVVNKDNPESYHLQPLGDVYFYTQNKWNENFRDKTFIFTFLSIGILILVTACFNYLNLLKARFNDDLKGMVLRKILGEPRKMNFVRMYMELCIYMFMGLIVSIAFTFLFLDSFNYAAGSNISLSFIFQPIVFLYYFLILGFLSLLLFGGMLYYYNRVNAVEILSSAKRKNSKNLPYFQVVQFTISTSLITCAIIILLQVKYIENKDLGFDRDVVEIKMPRNAGVKASSLKSEILKSNYVSGVSVAAASPILEHAEVLLNYDDSDKSKTYTASVFFGDVDFPSVLGLQLIAGKFIKSGMNNSNSCIINESMAKKFNMEYPVGNKVPGTNLMVVGVVKDFHFNSLTSLISPGYIVCDNSGSNILVKYKKNMQIAGINDLEECWNKTFVNLPFEYQLLDKRFELMHSDVNNLLKLVGLFSVIGIVLSMLGLFSYSIISTQSRKKEIGVRKVLGSSVGKVLMLLLIDFLKWILLASIISVPLVCDVMNSWLEEYAYRIDINWWMFALSFGIALIIAFSTVSSQVIKAASANPIESLKYE